MAAIRRARSRLRTVGPQARHDRYQDPSGARLAIALATIRHSAGAGASLPFATHSAVSPRAADGCIDRRMRKLNDAGVTSDAARLLS
jgi:hypothetical protein